MKKKNKLKEQNQDKIAFPAYLEKKPTRGMYHDSWIIKGALGEDKTISKKRHEFYALMFIVEETGEVCTLECSNRGGEGSA